MVILMDTDIPMNKPINDIHNHSLYQVDDGAFNIDVSIQMIEKAIADGTQTIILTPHVESKVTRADQDTRLKHFEILKKEVEKRQLNIQLMLGYEVQYQSHLKIDYQKYVINNQVILIEFSPFRSTPIEEICFDLVAKGFKVIVAHIERYEYLSFEDMIAIKQTGAYFQVNASSIIGYEAKKLKKKVKPLIDYKLIDFIATDAHNTLNRPYNLRACYEFLEKKVDSEYLNHIFYAHAQKMIIDGTS